MAEGTAEDGYDGYEEYDDDGGRRRGRGLAGCLAVLVALAVVCALGYVGATRGADMLTEVFQSDSAGEDYPGPGHGEVTFQVEQGQTVAEIGRNLKDAGVTKSVDAFLEAARADDRSAGIQVGYYPLAKEMKAADALDVLVDPENLMITAVTVPEGLRLTDIVALLADKTEFSKKQLTRALRSPKLGLPAYAKGNAEGYLFPSTYDIGPKDTAVDLLASMVQRWREEADAAKLEERARALGHTPAELMVIASLIEAEGRGSDMPKIARVIYNRLDGPGDRAGTNGLLQIDASVAYGLGKSPGSTEMSQEELARDTPYNTRLHPGLPPTPIEAPGADAIDAAANPADGDWYYYVTVDLATGETKFYADYDGFLEGQAAYKEYCRTKSDRC